METITEKEFDEVIKNKVLIDFYADWCGPCRMLSEVFEDIKNEINIEVKKINVDDTPEIAKRYGVMSIPTIIIFENSTEIKRNTGYLNAEELKEFLN